MKFPIQSPQLNVVSVRLENRGAPCCQTIPQLGALSLLAPTSPGQSSPLRVASPVGQICSLHMLRALCPC